MELYKELLINILSKEQINVVFPDFTINAAEVIERESYKTLQKIKAVIGEDSLSDFDCIEKIVRIFEELGSTGTVRHDF